MTKEFAQMKVFKFILVKKVFVEIGLKKAKILMNLKALDMIPRSNLVFLTLIISFKLLSGYFK